MSRIGSPPFSRVARDETDDLRQQLRDVMLCSHCGSSRLSITRLAGELGVAKSALWMFLEGKTDGGYMVALLREWLDDRTSVRYNDPDGSSVANRIASRVDARVSATTGGTGVVLSAGVVDQ